jgi:hypothetical protein
MAVPGDPSVNRISRLFKNFEPKYHLQPSPSLEPTQDFGNGVRADEYSAVRTDQVQRGHTLFCLYQGKTGESVAGLTGNKLECSGKCASFDPAAACLADTAIVIKNNNSAFHMTGSSFLSLYKPCFGSKYFVCCAEISQTPTAAERGDVDIRKGDNQKILACG